jgi:hypothetical protein
MAWIGLFHPLGETWNSIRLTRYTIVKAILGILTVNPEPLNLGPNRINQQKGSPDTGLPQNFSSCTVKYVFGFSTISIYSPQRRKERKGLVIIRKSALLFFAVLPVRRYFYRINGKE